MNCFPLTETLPLALKMKCYASVVISVLLLGLHSPLVSYMGATFKVLSLILFLREGDYPL